MLVPLHRVPVRQLLRFAFVGFVFTFAYMAITYISVQVLALRPVSASLVGFCFCIPLSYLGQKHLTFRSRGAHRVELPRFITTRAVAFCGTVGSMAVVDALGWNYRVGILAAVVLVPLGSFIAMSLWVFRPRPSRQSKKKGVNHNK